MGMDVGKVSIEYLDRPQGAAYEFIKELACEASCVGDGNAFGFYLRADMEARANEFASRQQAAEEEAKELMAWVSSLPWDENGYLTLTFNW